jgi:EAL and modified HD-GYP domain-containing signal transduction protein
MPDLSVLGQVALGYGPIVDPQRAVVATRLTVFPANPQSRPDAQALLQALDEVWPPPPPAGPVAAPGRPPAGPAPLPPLCLNPAGEALLRGVLAQPLAAHRMLEVPAFMAGDATVQSRLLALGGMPLMLKGRPLAPLPPEVLACFGHVMLEPGEERRSQPAAEPGRRTLGVVHAGLGSAAQIQSAFAQGAAAVCGWPFDDPLPKSAKGRAAAPDVQAVMALIDGVNRGHPVGRLEPILTRDPALAFRLMRYLNSPAFGLSVEVTSLGHALMLLGHERLKRWLALLLASASKDANARPLLYAAVRRALVMEELGRPQRDSAVAGEMFLCGLFSLLDRLLAQPMDELLASLPVPERVHAGLSGGGGPYAGYLALVRAMEQAVPSDILEAADTLLLAPAELNRALLAALAAANSLD